MKKQTDSPGVIAPPPVIYLGGLVIGFLLRYIKPLEFLENNSLRFLGWSLIVISIVIFTFSLSLFKH